MGTEAELKNKSWWGYIEEDLQELLLESLLLIKAVKSWGVDLPGAKRKFHDYAFLVFPAAKAYEGFLKKLFLDLGFIGENDYFGKQFRIGKSLNPKLDKRYQDESWVYDDLTKYCEGEELPAFLWKTWKNSRNLLFHWFPEEKNAISFKKAVASVNMIVEAIDEAFKTCKVKVSR